MNPSVFEHLAKRFSECHAEIKHGKRAHHAVEALIPEAGKALFEAISSKAIDLKDAPTSFDYVPKKKVEGGGKRKAWDIYWLNAVYWICVNRREIFPDWPGNNAAELLWTVRVHPDRLIDDSLEETILHLRSVLEGSYRAPRDQRSKIKRRTVKVICLDLTSLFEDVCSYLAHILASKPEPAKIEQDNKAVTLLRFMQGYCEEQKLSPLKCRRKSLNDAHNRGAIKLPELARRWKSGQSKYYKASDLIEKWPSYRDALPNLPSLKQES